MPYVYILSDYEEDGAENVCATLDRSKVIAMFEKYFPGDHVARTDQTRPGLESLLLKTDSELSSRYYGWDCTPHWGGVQLHVVEMFK